MREKLINKLKQNRAFTMIEMMIVVGITVVLLAVSIIAISDMTKNLKMTELDDYAKTIYLEAQNQLAVVEVEGGLGRYYDDISDLSRTGSSRFLKDLQPGIPKDYPVNNEENPELDERWKQLCYLTEADTVLIQKMIPVTSDIYVKGGSYVIEFNPQTGDIYGVFYWESDEDITYESLMEKVGDRSRAARMDAKIGYYGGMVAGDLVAGEDLGMDVSLVNGEELYLKISFPNTEEILSFYNTALDISVTIEGEREVASESVDAEEATTEKVAVKFDSIDLSNKEVTIDKINFYFLLDSMQEGHHFQDIVSAQVESNGNEDIKIVPGENIKVTVESYFNHDGGMWDDNFTTVLEGNSLFGFGTGVDETTGEKKLCISSVRHMQNLNAMYYDNSEFGNRKNVVTFISDVDFSENAYAWKYNEENKAIYVGYGNGQKPISTFAPISNEGLFVDTKVTGSSESYSKVLRNFVVEGTANGVGLFAKTTNVDFKNIYIEDITVNALGYNNVGTLVGQMNGGNVDNCGAYLSTSEIVKNVETERVWMEDPVDGCIHDNAMEHHYATVKVSGKTSVGGLIGYYVGSTAAETSITNSFAAVRVDALDGSYVGGFIGEIKNDASENKKLTIKNTYSSGDVYGNNYVGGFIGSVSTINNNVLVENVYSTSDVEATNNFGGLLGKSTGAKYNNVISYGQVHQYGSTTFNTNTNVGAFIASAANSGSTYTDCKYMVQNGYNTSNSLKDPSGIKKADYFTLKNGATAVVSYPYHVDLNLDSFPFASVIQPVDLNQNGEDDDLVHYGDWPKEFVIDTSLVYYERYADGAYGYYCVTTLSNNTRVEGDNSVWILDTLQDRECVEDGYALLTKYNLRSIDYTLYVGDKEEAAFKKSGLLNGTDNVVQKNTLTSRSYDNGKFLRLNQQGNLTFTEYGGYDYVNGEKVGTGTNTFDVSGLYLYQLPYEAQCTGRMGVEYFYDRIEITAKAYTSKGGSKEVITDLSYYYCPHYAKTAVNPNVNDGNSITKPENPVNVYIRSARHLNALGRFPYYWNERGYVAGSKVSYIQETDVNFSTYATANDNEKIYAGQPFDLQSFGEVYSNRPIGDPDLAGTSAQFRNIYDGRSNRIIDYCVDGMWVEYVDGQKVGHFTQFTGLFGEINDATLKNIVMMVSENPSHENAGLITSSFRITDLTEEEIENAHEIRPWEDGFVKRAGLGALVGLAYETKTTSNQIINCVSAGYTVRYNIISQDELESRGFEAGVHPLGVAVGGLMGFNMSNVSNCAAANNVVVDMTEDYIRSKDSDDFNFIKDLLEDFFDWILGNNDKNKGQGAVYVGGFAGSCFYGTVSNCYSGGTIDFEDHIDNGNDFKYGIARLRVGGFCPGWLDTPVSDKNWSNYTVTYLGIYSLTEVSDVVWNIKAWDDDTGEGSVNEKFTYYVPLVSRMVEQEKNDNTSIDFLLDYLFGEGWGITYAPGDECRCVGTYHINEVSSQHANKSGAKTYYEDNWDWLTHNTRTSEPISLAGMKEVTVSGTVNNTPYNLSHDANVTYIVDKKDENNAYIDSYPSYPYPEVIYEVDSATGEPVLNENGTTKYVHYGEWYIQKTYATSNYPVYYEKYTDGTFGYVYIAKDKKVWNSLSKDLPIEEAGYAEFLANPNDSHIDENTVKVKILNDELNENGYTYYLIKYDTEALFDQYGSDGRSLRSISLPYVYRIATFGEGVFLNEYVDGEPAKEYFFNPYYGAALSVDDLGTEANPLQVRTEEQLSNVSKTTEAGVVIKLTHSIVLGGNYESVNINSGITFDGNQENGYEISNAGSAVFATNSGTIKNTKVVNSNVLATKAYGFAAENNGTIKYCLVTGTVTGTDEAAGFVGLNSGDISNCYANTNVTCESGIAAGFAIESTNTTYSYSVGTVKGSTAYGFMQKGSASNCYTLTDLVSSQDGVTNNLYGFAGTTDSNVTDCVWGYYSVKGSNGSESYNLAATLQAKNTGNFVGTYKKLSDIDAMADYETVAGNTYPYPTVGIPHYGSYPIYSGFNTVDNLSGGNHAGIFYYETYQDEVSEELIYALYAKGRGRTNNDRWAEESNVINTLKKDTTIQPISKGYGVYCNSGNPWYYRIGTETTNRSFSNLSSSFEYKTGYVFHVFENGATSITVNTRSNNWNNNRVTQISISQDDSQDEIKDARSQN